MPTIGPEVTGTLDEKAVGALRQWVRSEGIGTDVTDVVLPLTIKLKIISNHKFNIAFENSSYPGYVTEKITDAFIANTIPIYWGDKKS